MEIRTGENYQAVEIKAANGFEAHQFERDGSIIGYVSRPSDSEEWTLVLPDGTEVAKKEASLDAAGDTLFKIDNQMVFKQYTDDMLPPS